MLVNKLSCHRTLCFRCRGLGAHKFGSLLPVLQATAPLQELTSSQASSTTQAVSCRSRPSGVPPIPLGVSGGLHHRGCFVTATLETEGLSNFLGQFVTHWEASWFSSSMTGQ